MGARTLFLTIAGYVLSCGSVHAQLFDLGFKAGASRDDLTTEYAHEGVWGGHVGLFARIKPPVWPGLQGEVLLTSLGSRVTVLGETAELRSLSVQTPLLVVMAFGPVELHAGAYYEYYLTRSIATRFDIDLDELQNELPVEAGRLNDDGFGYLLGAGVRFKHFYAGARYNIGATPLGSGPFLDGLYTRQLQAYLGVGLFSATKSRSKERDQERSGER